MIVCDRSALEATKCGCYGLESVRKRSDSREYSTCKIQCAPYRTYQKPPRYTLKSGAWQVSRNIARHVNMHLYLFDLPRNCLRSDQDGSGSSVDDL